MKEDKKKYTNPCIKCNKVQLELGYSSSGDTFPGSSLDDNTSFPSELG